MAGRPEKRLGGLRWGKALGLLGAARQSTVSAFWQTGHRADKAE